MKEVAKAGDINLPENNFLPVVEHPSELARGMVNDSQMVCKLTETAVKRTIVKCEKDAKR